MHEVPAVPSGRGLPGLPASLFAQRRIPFESFLHQHALLLRQYCLRMGLFDFFRAPSPEPSTTRRVVREASGPLTAHEAWALAEPDARALDDGARLTLLTSGSDAGPDGRSFTWEFGFELPTSGGYVLLSIEPSADAEEIDYAPLVLTRRISRDVRRGARAPLPVPFVDSPQAAAALARRGVDFVAGPSDLYLQARVEPSGEAVWVSEGWDGERSVPFAPDAP